jgi:hypothetical protein
LGGFVEKALAARDIPDNVYLVHLTFRSEADELAWETELRETNPAEAARLDMLLEGRLPA